MREALDPGGKLGLKNSNVQSCFNTHIKNSVDVRIEERAGAKGRAFIAFFHHAVVAVPMRVQMTFLARAL